MIRFRSAVLLAAVLIPASPVSADEAAVPARDERFRLDITERRIDRGPYDASLDVRVDRPVNVRVGVALSAAHITVFLRGVRGDVQFHGDLSQLTRVIAAHSGRAVSDQEKL